MCEILSNVNFSSEIKKYVSILFHNPSYTLLIQFLYAAMFLKNKGPLFLTPESVAKRRVTAI
jgi:hypothetical protein